MDMMIADAIGAHLARDWSITTPNCRPQAPARRLRTTERLFKLPAGPHLQLKQGWRRNREEAMTYGRRTSFAAAMCVLAGGAAPAGHGSPPSAPGPHPPGARR